MADLTREEVVAIFGKLVGAELSGATYTDGLKMADGQILDTYWPDGFNPVASGAVFDESISGAVRPHQWM